LKLACDTYLKVIQTTKCTKTGELILEYTIIKVKCLRQDLTNKYMLAFFYLQVALHSQALLKLYIFREVNLIF